MLEKEIFSILLKVWGMRMSVLPSIIAKTTALIVEALLEVSEIPATAEEGTVVGIDELEEDSEAPFLLPCGDVGRPIIFPVVETEATNVVGVGGGGDEAV
jgi:hypothetical protein